MYDRETRESALKLLEQGYSAYEASVMMGGKPSKSAIHRWSQGFEPSGKRSKRCALLATQKLDAIKRVDAGEDVAGVADALGCSPKALLAWCRKYHAGGIDALRTRLDMLHDKGEG